MVSSVGVSNLGKTTLHFVNPSVKVNGEYYRNELLEMMLQEEDISSSNKMGRGHIQHTMQLHTSKITFLSSLNKKIGRHQRALTCILWITAFGKICHRECVTIKGLGMCNTSRIYWNRNGKNCLHTRLMHVSISLDIV